MKRLLIAVVGALLLLICPKARAGLSCKDNSIFSKIAGVARRGRGRGVHFSHRGTSYSGWFQLTNGDIVKLTVNDVVAKDFVAKTTTSGPKIHVNYERNAGASLGAGMYHYNYERDASRKLELDLTSSKNINQFSRQETYTRELGRSTFLDAPPGAWTDNYLLEVVLKYPADGKKPSEATLNIYNVDVITNAKKLGVSITGDNVLSEVQKSFKFIK